jgi:son of sevenless-like protein
MLKSEWTKKNGGSPNILNLISWFNKFSLHITTLIVSESNIDKRVELLSNSILLAYMCHKINNHNAVFEILSGITNSSISRYKFLINFKFYY